ncbi:sensor domain-containing diguanylate cyclase [Alteromonas sp. RKMC-009]|uniref:sensor domain-containing diguanylate cyclase n=1 Tax=Alteromonas sp. RKMC-009 TaxID=2267264 RepID=UPI0010C55FB4|nr:sensor domain-containing diguanylate cyclase [Alteromonas sp. RKMC-009]AYA64167.2 sensor domain-containing diguanylate cyclase [Alteromonas sp. RKMC-009]
MNNHSTPMSAQPLLNNQLAFTELLSTLTSRLINVKHAELDPLIEQSLGAYGKFRGVQRCYLFRFSADKTTMANTHEWVASGVQPYKQQLQGVVTTELPYFTRAIFSEQLFRINDVSDLPEEAAGEKAEFQRENISSILCVAIRINDELTGFVGCDVVGSPYEWQDNDVRYLKLIGEILSNTLESQANRIALERVSNELLAANQKLDVLANSDGLTGIANRRFFDNSLLKAIRRCARSCNTLNLVMLDVDFFKQYNDTYGHVAGDEVLKKISEVLSRVARRPDDVAARYGGEEFAVLLPCIPAEEAHSITQTLLDEIAALAIPFPESAVSDFITVSAGIASLRCDKNTRPVELILLADKALYRAKQNGRKGIVHGEVNNTQG